MHHVLARAWSPIGHLNSVLNGEELRAAYNACLPLLTSYHTELAQNAALCAAYQRILDREGPQLVPEQRKLLENALRDFRLAGVSLPEDRKQRFRQVMEQLAACKRVRERARRRCWSRVVGDERTLRSPGDRQRARAAAQARACRAGAARAPNYRRCSHCDDEPLRRGFYEPG
jgi:oligopeptidase A